jgi:hypothetical protein
MDTRAEGFYVRGPNGKWIVKEIHIVRGLKLPKFYIDQNCAPPMAKPFRTKEYEGNENHLVKRGQKDKITSEILRFVKQLSHDHVERS